MQTINDTGIVNVKIESVVRIIGVVGVTCLRFFPCNDLAHIFHHGFTFGNILQGKNTLTMDA